MATDPSADLPLTLLDGDTRPLGEWLTTFPLVLVALDPFTAESAAVLPTAGRILGVYEQADCRVAWLLTADADDARRFLGPLAREVLTFVDPGRSVVQALGLGELPAFIHLRQDGSVAGAAEGWRPDEWRAVADNLSRVTAWSRPLIPEPGDPDPYVGSPALG